MDPMGELASIFEKVATIDWASLRTSERILSTGDGKHAETKQHSNMRI